MKWEYRTFLWETRKGFLGGKLDRQGLEDQLNLVGQDGWELVSVSNPTMDGGSTRNLVLILKRVMASE